jgi:hypothetical protein
MCEQCLVWKSKTAVHRKLNFIEAIAGVSMQAEIKPYFDCRTFKYPIRQSKQLGNHPDICIPVQKCELLEHNDVFVQLQKNC